MCEYVRESVRHKMHLRGVIGCALPFQCVNVNAFLCLHAQRCPVNSPRVDSFYLRRTPDKHIRMYLCCPGLRSQNCTISFAVPASLLNRLCETVICTHRGGKQSIKKGLVVAFKRLTEFYVPLQNVNKCAFL